MMFKNYIKIAFRNLVKYKIYSFINIIGLAIGLTSCLLIFLFVHHELNYDRFHKKAQQIYRTDLRFNMGSNHFDSPFCPVPLGPTLVDEYPEVLTSTRLYTTQYRNIDVYLRYRDYQFKEQRFFWADATIFEVFTISFRTGDPNTALGNPNSLVLTSQMADKYFGTDDPIGKMLILHDGSIYKVTGVVEPLPSNSHFQFDFLASFSSIAKSRDPEWYDTAVLTYVLLPEQYDWHFLNEKMPDLSQKYVAPVIEQAMGMSYEKFIETGNYFGFFLEPLLDVHLYSEVDEGLGPSGSIHTVYIFSGIAILILLVACINFINLATARSALRANEVGVRKVVGSHRGQLIGQFLTESVMYSLVALVIAVIMLEITLPYMNDLLGLKLSSRLFRDELMIPFLLGFVLFLGIMAGIYPALLLSGFQPVEVLKGKVNSGLKGRRFRQGLAIFQFTSSIILIIGTLVIYHQLQYIRNKNLGFNKEQVVVIPNAAKLGKQQQVFKERMKQYQGIVSASYTDCLPQMMLEVKPFQKVGSESHENHTLITIMSDYDFMDTYQFKLIDGRFFEKTRSADSSALLLNEAAVKSLNLRNPLHEQLTWLGLSKERMEIIGILRDFHLEPLHMAIRPMASMLMRDKPGEFLSIRIEGGHIPESIRYIETQWNDFVPQQPLEYVFFDNQFGQIYQKEIQAGRIITIFAALAIIIACLGLYGLASFTAIRRIKEIGIRRVFGASGSSIFILLSKEFTKWVALSNLIAWPIAWYAMNQWLQNFAYRINISWWIYVFAGMMALLIALLTVSWQAVRAAMANPVEALRYE